MSDPEPAERALELAYGYIGRRERTVHEVRHHLTVRRVEPEDVEVALTGLQDQGLLDDVRFARLFTEDKQALEGWGSDRIHAALLGRGIARGLADEALAGSRSSELDRALELLRRRFPVPCRDRRARDRALGFLLRKGYDGDLALDALAAHSRGG